MAQTFIAIGAAVKATASAVGASVSSLFSGGAGAAGSASTLSSALSVGSALSSIASGVAGASAQRDMARQVQVQAAQSAAADAQERASLAEEYRDLIADQKAVQLANGLNPGVGTPKSVRDATRTFAERNLATSRENTRLRTRTARLQSRSLFKSANTSLLRGFTSAGQTLADNHRATG